MKKLLISSAIAAAMGTSGYAHAVVDFTEATADRVVSTYASELAVPQAGLVLTAPGAAVPADADQIAEATTDLDVVTELGFGVADTQRRFIRVSLSGGDATFEAAPTVTIDTATAPVTATVSQGGVGENFVVLEFTANGAGVEDTQVDIAGYELNVESKSNVTLTYDLYETAVDAANANTANRLATSSGVVAQFASALEISAAATVDVDGVDNVKQIDVTQESVLFDSATNPTGSDISNIGFASVALVENSDDLAFVRAANGEVILQLDEILDDGDSSAILSGNFSSATSLSNDDGATRVAIDTTDFVNADGDAVFDITGDFAAESVNYTFQYETDGETQIPESTYSLTLELAAASTAFEVTSPVGPIEMDTFAKNGSTAFTNLNLDPNGAFANFIRITNPSSIDGRVFLTVINDDGESVSLTLDDISVAGAALPAALNAGASTRLIPMTSIIAAAQTEDSTFGTVSTPRNKFRIVADGEFGDSSNNTAIRIDNVTLATDNSTFSTF